MATRAEVDKAHAEANELWEDGDYAAAREAQLRAVELENTVEVDNTAEVVSAREDE